VRLLNIIVALNWIHTRCRTGTGNYSNHSAPPPWFALWWVGVHIREGGRIVCACVCVCEGGGKNKKFITALIHKIKVVLNAGHWGKCEQTTCISNQGENQESRVVELQQGHKFHAPLIWTVSYVTVQAPRLRHQYDIPATFALKEVYILCSRPVSYGNIMSQQ